MFVLVGWALAMVCIFGVYIFHGGNIQVVLTALPFEMITIFGAAAGAFLANNQMKVIKATFRGLGHGLAALRRCWPQAQIEGIEWSRVLRLGAALRCPWARVRRGDMWAADWRGCTLVYLFQRPESMARAWDKARAELAPGAWLLSLDFAVPGVAPTLLLQRPGRQALWAYRLELAATSAQPVAVVADIPGNKPAHPGRR